MRYTPIAFLLAATIGLAACANTGTGANASADASTDAASPSHTMGATHGTTDATAAPTDAGAGDAGVDSAAANLRTDLDYVLGEHIILASKATGAALGGRQDEFEAYGALLNTNGTDIGEMIGSVYGDDARDQFNQIWSAHNGFFVDYTTGVASGDQAMADKAVDDLTTIYVPDFSAFISGATGLPEEAVAELTTAHVTQTKAIVDAQAAGDWETAYAAIREAYAHMQMIGDAVASGIVDQNADAIDGDPATAGADLRVALDQLLQEHLYLATFATGAALDGRNDEFAAAGAALNENGTDIGAAIGSLYGDDARDQFNQIWSAHNGFFVDYTTGVATDDQAMADKAVEDLTTVYVPQFAEFLAGATDLPEDTLADLTSEHVVSTKDVVDAQASGDASAAAEADRTAAQHMRMIGDPLAAAIVEKLPDQFAG
ncbi:MAG: hypothetical protein M3295_10350 [Chloroflexota bacterium]|nr:hypothetical protein [Chloroflexota bacterium]